MLAFMYYNYNLYKTFINNLLYIDLYSNMFVKVNRLFCSTNIKEKNIVIHTTLYFVFY